MMSWQSLLLLCFCAGALGGPLDFLGISKAPAASVVQSRDVATAAAPKPNSTGRFLTGFLDKVTDTVGSSVNGGMNVAGTILNGTKDVANTVIGGAKDTVGSALEGNIVDSLGNIVNTTYNVMDRISVQACNTGADFLLAQFKTIATAFGAGDKVPLPAFNIDIAAGNKLYTEDGYFSSPKRVMRPADVNVTRSGLRTLYLDVPVEIKNLTIVYDKYTISTWLGDTGGRIEVSVADNKIKIRLKITISVTCMINLEKVELTDIHGISVNLTSDCAYCGVVTSSAATYIASFVENTIRAQIQAQLDAILSSVLSNDKLPVCSKFIGL